VERLILTTLNGIALGSLLFIVSAGLTLTFGVMRILNLAHGALYMVGAFVGWTIAVSMGLGFGLGIAAGGVAAALIGLLLERLFLRHLHGSFNEQAVLTFGIILIITNLSLWIWGPFAKPAFSPSFLSGSIRMLGLSFPTARFGLIVTAAITATVLWEIDKRTLLGARVRAGRDDREMLEALGIDFSRLATGLFVFGAFLAGGGGVLGAQVVGVNLELSSSILLLAIVVVVVGGLGSVAGSFLGAMIIGCILSISTGYLPVLGSFTIYLLMVAILVLRPRGLVRGSS
jgi:branched-chain amino acid transport system permease protein